MLTPSFAFAVGNLNDASIVTFDNEEGLTNYISESESKGRLAVLNFPSTIYESGSLQKRFDHFLSPLIVNKEYYSIQSFLNFGFSPCSPYSDQEKVDILYIMVEMFSLAHDNQIFMFSSPRSYSDMEILYKKSSLVIMLPLLNFSAVAAIIIDSDHITKDFCGPYLQKNAPLIKGDEIINIISMMKECILKGNSSFVSFYEQCKKETKCADVFKTCLNPSIASQFL